MYRRKVPKMDPIPVFDLSSPQALIRFAILERIVAQAGALPPLPDDEVYHLSGAVIGETLGIKAPQPRKIEWFPDNAPLPREKMIAKAAQIRQAGHVPCMVTCSDGQSGWGGMACVRRSGAQAGGQPQ